MCDPAAQAAGHLNMDACGEGRYKSIEAYLSASPHQSIACEFKRHAMVGMTAYHTQLYLDAIHHFVDVIAFLMQQTALSY